MSCDWPEPVEEASGLLRSCEISVGVSAKPLTVKKVASVTAENREKIFTVILRKKFTNTDSLFLTERDY